MGPSAPPNRLGRPGSSLYLIDSIGVSPSYRLSRPFRPTYVLYLRENVHDILCRGWCA